MSAHTPGPWLMEPAIGTDDVDCGWHIEPVIVDYKYRGMVCSLNDAEHIGGITKQERDANARLIAASPDLLAACLALKAAGPLGQREWNAAADMMDAAIAKATGEA